MCPLCLQYLLHLWESCTSPTYIEASFWLLAPSHSTKNVGSFSVSCTFPNAVYILKACNLVLFISLPLLQWKSPLLLAYTIFFYGKHLSIYYVDISHPSFLQWKWIVLGSLRILFSQWNSLTSAPCTFRSFNGEQVLSDSALSLLVLDSFASSSSAVQNRCMSSLKHILHSGAFPFLIVLFLHVHSFSEM